ncbi:hypothetical protein [Rhizomonospora bruguierae]|uniref:hypothetical protein n=1 Tax=Rhizomonospora bruguierae TaxID=1581705 RepID=UPI001BCDF1F9|nr:hypothetical protein [Micromonospora sp. NBRC 107566]
MSDVTGAPAERTRPAIVTTAGYLLYVVAAVQVINAIAAISTAGTVSRVYKEWAAGTPAESGGTFAVVGSIASAVIGLIIGVVLVVLAIFNNRGSNGTRITTWVLSGILLCCTGLGFAGSAVNSGLSGGGGTPDPKVLQERLTHELPGWYNGVTMTSNVITVLALLAVVILLALPPANAFFRKPAQVWEPPVPGYPTYPPAPGGPGAPGGPAAPGGPQAPGGPGAPPPPPAG